MRHFKSYILIIILILISGIVLFTNSKDRILPKINFKKYINNKQLYLVIHYVDLDVLTFNSLSEDDLKNWSLVQKIEIQSDRLINSIDYLNKISDLKLEKREEYPNVRISCEFFASNRSIFQFSLGGIGENMAINRKVFKSDKIFYDLIEDFIPYESKAHYEEIVKKCFASPV